MDTNQIIENWLLDLNQTAWNKGRINQKLLQSLGLQLVEALQKAIEAGVLTEDLRKVLESISVMGVKNQLTPGETVLFIYKLRFHLSENANEFRKLMGLLDEAAVYTFEIYLKNREDIIRRQSQDLLDVSNPVIKIWDRIIAAPLIGTLDSKRTLEVMEKILNMIAQNGAQVAILDITGVATVDTLVANHIMKTAAAVRLLGAKLIITGISPAIAQTMVQLGVDLGAVITRSVMADGLALAMKIVEGDLTKNHVIE